jgi:hypothetical protein
MRCPNGHRTCKKTGGSLPVLRKSDEQFAAAIFAALDLLTIGNPRARQLIPSNIIRDLPHLEAPISSVFLPTSARLFDSVVIRTTALQAQGDSMDHTRNRLNGLFPHRRSPRVPGELRGKWVAWDRDQTRIVASGHTFEEAKGAAGAAGESSVLMARVPTRVGRPMLYMVAVFISQ